MAVYLERMAKDLGLEFESYQAKMKTASMIMSSSRQGWNANSVKISVLVHNGEVHEGLRYMQSIPKIKTTIAEEAPFNDKGLDHIRDSHRVAEMAAYLEKVSLDMGIEFVSAHKKIELAGKLMEASRSGWSFKSIRESLISDALEKQKVVKFKRRIINNSFLA